MERYSNRLEAGQVLAEELKPYANKPDVVVLALPRGGVPVAYEIAKALSVPLDVFIVRKLGVPGHEELAMGAMAMSGEIIFNNDIIQQLQINKTAIDSVIRLEKEELDRRNITYRGGRSFSSCANKVIILVDDGIATGATMRAAITALRQHKPTCIILAVPVAEVTVLNELAKLVDKVVCPLKTRDLYAVGAWYEDFSQTMDEEVYQLLAKSKKRE